MGNQPAAFQLHINHKLIPNVSQKVVVSFIYIQRKDGVYFMSTKKLLTLALGSALLMGGLAGCSSSVNIPSDNNTTKNVSYQAQTVSDTENAANDSTTAELPGGSVDYSIYEPYGLSYDQENYYFTYNGNVVRFFNDPMVDFNIGDEVIVYYDGNIAESYPLQINTVYAISLKDPAN